MIQVPTAGTLVLCYHNLVRDGTPDELLEAQLGVAASAFAGQMRYLTRQHQGVTFEDIERGTGVRNGLVLTFDDGYRGVFEFGLPLLTPYRPPVYVFVNPAFVGGWNPRDKLMALALYGSPAAVRDVEGFLGVTMGADGVLARARRFVEWRGPMWRALSSLGADSVAQVEALFARYADAEILRRLEPSRLLSWDELGALRKAGFRIANHALRHLELDALPRETVRTEITAAQRLLRERLGCDEPVISYPRGKANAVVREEATSAGYRWGLTTVPGRIPDRAPSLSAPRVLVSSRGGIAGLRWKASRVRLWARRYVTRVNA